jgi:thiol:disulfide interchange protein
MKPITWLATFTVGLAALTSSAIAEPHKGWSTDIEAALVQAKKENKAVLLEFTGSDWCPPCIMMRKEVFSKAEFVSAASKKFVLVEIDVPRGDKEVAEKNRPIAEKYEIKGYPTVILLDSDGKEFTRFFATEHPAVDSFLAHLESSLEKKDLD